MDGMILKQHALIMALQQDEDSSVYVEDLINNECPLCDKYMVINMENLIQLNCENVDQLHRVTIAFSILEKYTRHLLKPEEKRSNMWRYVKFCNQIFKDRVDSIQGGRELMKMMGYTKDIKDGLSFPTEGKTNPELLMKVLADILLGKQELNLYLAGSHPYRRYIDKLLPVEVIEELKRFQANLHSRYKEISERKIEPQIIENERIEAVTSRTETNVDKRTDTMSSYSTNANQTSVRQIDSNQIPLVARLMAQGKSISSVSSVGEIDPKSVIMSNMSGDITANNAAQLSNQPALEPKTQSNQFSSDSSMVQYLTTEETAFPSGSACDICGNRQAEVICEICDNKQLCMDCDDKWHQHPRRQNHHRQNRTGDGEEPQKTNDIMPQKNFNKVTVYSPEIVETSSLQESANSSSFAFHQTNVVGQLSQIDIQRPSMNESHQHTKNQNYQTASSLYSSQPQLSRSSDFQPGNMSAPGGPPTSRLLPSIVNIPDLHRRKAKLDINLMTLKEEIEEVEIKINELITQNAHFFSDPEYATLYKRKGMLTREKIELEHYDKELTLTLQKEEQNYHPQRSMPDVLTQPIIYPPQFTPQPTPSAGYLVYSYIPPVTMTPGCSLSPTTQGQQGYSFIPQQIVGAPHFPNIVPGQSFTPERQDPFHLQQMRSHVPMANLAQNQANFAQNQPNMKTPPQKKMSEDKNVFSTPEPKQSTFVQSNPLEVVQNSVPPVPHRKSNAPHAYVNVPNSAAENSNTNTNTNTNVTSWICAHCTFHNKNSSKICQMCSKTSHAIAKPECTTNKMPTTRNSDDENETAVVEVGQHINEVHDQIYNEKKLAQQQYRERIQKQAAPVQPLSKPKVPEPVVVEPVKKQEMTDVMKSSQLVFKRTDAPATTQAESGSTGEKLSESSSSSKNLAETLGDIQRKKQYEEMLYNGKYLLNIFKNHEKNALDAEEVELAVEFSDDISVDKWLKEKWLPLIDRVIHMATNQGAESDQNNVGEISVLESKEALKLYNCDEQKAVKHCIENRKKMYKEIQKHGNFAREEILQAMLHSQGDIEKALDELNSKWLVLFQERIWPSDEVDDNIRLDQLTIQDSIIARANDMCNSITNSILSRASFQAVIMDMNVDLERRIRLILVEGKLQSWGRAEIVIKILDEEVATKKIEASLEEVVEAVKNCGDRLSSLVFLKQYCQICYSQFPMSKIRNLGCDCKICLYCVHDNFEIAIREKHVRNLHCPMCSQPDMENVEAASDYLTFLTLLLQTLVSQELIELFHSKLRDWHLQKDPNFRWCAHCGNGFIWTIGNETLRMLCPTCQQGTCFSCKKIWEEQHEGLSCEEYAQWKIDNDPDNQTAGLARYLEDNGIDCPSCKMKYSLAKGGCMHFKCPQCGFEFCSGCSQSFYQKGVCRKYVSCRNRGLHCHHPRNCLYYLRDEDMEDLQKLLKNNKIQFDTTAASDHESCPVMEQKEDPEGKRDEACGREVHEGSAGLCLIHYKEYMVSLINKHNVDPLAIMSIDAMVRLIEREERRVPERKTNEQDNHYKKKLEQIIKDIEPLNRQQ